MNIKDIRLNLDIDSYWIPTHYFEYFFKKNGYLVDPVDNKKPDKYGDSGNSVNSGISNLFLPIPANPSDKVRADFTINTFSFSKEEDSINSSDESLKEFVTYVCKQAINSAKKSKKEIHKKADQEEWRFITGDKGIGKTHLQNYLISKYSDVFDQSNILWVRINMIREYGDLENLDLNDWISAQATKILCRYYDTNSNYYIEKPENLRFDFRRLLEKHIEKRKANRRLYSIMHEELDTLLSRLMDDRRDWDLNPSWIRKSYADEVVSDAKSRGMKIVVVIDGMDLLSTSTTAAEKNLESEKSISNYLKDDLKVANYSLVFLRPETLYNSLELRKLYDIDQNSTTHASGKAGLHVGKCNPSEIINKRIMYANTEIFEKISEKDISRFNEHLASTDSLALGTANAGSTVLDVALSICNESARAAMQFMSIVAIHSSRESLKNYEITELAMLGTRKYPPTSYMYLRSPDGKLSRESKPDYRQFDILHLPSIFEFPYDSNENINMAIGELGVSAYSWGLRILQVIREFHLATGKKISVEVLAKFLSVTFDYPLDRTLLILEEFIEYELVSLKEISKAMRFRNILYMECEITAKGELILSEYIYDATYLGISAMTLPVPREVINETPTFARLINCTGLGSRDSVDWVVGKIVNSYTLGSLLIKAELDQHKRYMDIKPDLLKEYPVEFVNNFERNSFNIGDELVNKLEFIWNRTLNGMSKGKGQRVVSIVSADMNKMKKNIFQFK